MSKRILSVALGVTTLFWAGAMTASAATAPAGTPVHHHVVKMSKDAMYGGKTWQSKEHIFETVFMPDGVRVYMYSTTKSPQALDGAAGTVSLKFKDGTTKDVTLAVQAPASGDKALYYCTMHPEVVKTEPGNCPKCNMALVEQNRLFGAQDLSQVKPGDIKATVHLTGLGGTESEVSFTEVNGHGHRADSGHTGAAKGEPKS